MTSLDSFFMGHGVGSGGGAGGGPKVGPKTVVTVTALAAGLGILYLVLRKPDPPGHWRESLEPSSPLKPSPPKSGPGPSRAPRTDQIRGWGNYR